MVEQHQEYHKEIPETNFKLELLRTFRRPLERQTFEGIKISTSEAIPINRKGEWGQNLPPKFTCTDEGAPINRSKS